MNISTVVLAYRGACLAPTPSVIQLLGGGGSFKCPECRAQHAAPSKEKTFPQNKYLLTVIKRRESREGGGARRGEKVEKYQIGFNHVYSSGSI